MAAATEPPPPRAIPPRERLIVALDFANPGEARRLVRALGDAVAFYKVGLELFCADGAFPFVRELLDGGRKVFLDLKLLDIPATVGAAVRNVRAQGAHFVTVHAGRRVLEAACAEKGATGVLAVTVLTSLDAADLRDLGYPPSVTAEDLVLQRARTALAAGCDGVVASPLEVRRLRAELGDRLAIVTPGIRPASPASGHGAGGGDDQRRVATPRTAFEAGADYVVIGRPIREAPDPRAAALAVQATIAELFG
ncbi:MAG: orotidine-5'-phosphate decarboxylase [Deltaproteobacteria bacterium]|nr:orotidine-5'-phosphate decarboxylase [Deltaproteobacteria bacterium]